MLLPSLLIACALQASPVRLPVLPNAPTMSAAGFDQRVYDLTTETLDRSICTRLNYRYAKLSEPLKTFAIELDQRAASTHCQKSFEQHFTSGGATECGQGLIRN